MKLRPLVWCSFLVAALLHGVAAGAAARSASRTVLHTGSLTASGHGAGEIESFMLANGMTFIVWPDHDIPNVALQNFVRVGSRNETSGNTGLAHFFEHMMFRGTRTHAPGEFDRVMEDAGGNNNASTSEDVTIYQDWFASSALETVLQLEADRLQNLAFVPEVVEGERNVVYSERRLSVEDDNAARLAEQVQATAFLAHPYHTPVIGWPADILHWRMEDLEQFYRKHYVPNNCTMIIVGDVDIATVRRLAERYFAAIPAQLPAAAPHTIEPQQEGERRVIIQRAAQTPLLQIAYHGLAATDAEFPALELLVRILAGGESSRLQQALVEQQPVAIAISPMLVPMFDPGLVWFFVTLPAQANVEQAQQAFDGEIARLIADGVSLQELGKVRNQVLSEYWQRLATINGKAEMLGQYAVFNGDYHQLFTAAAEYDKVTPAAIKALAQRVLDARRRTVGILLPSVEEASAAVAHEQEQEAAP